LFARGKMIPCGIREKGRRGVPFPGGKETEVFRRELHVVVSKEKSFEREKSSNS